MFYTDKIKQLHIYHMDFLVYHINITFYSSAFQTFHVIYFLNEAN